MPDPTRPVGGTPAVLTGPPPPRSSATGLERRGDHRPGISLPWRKHLEEGSARAVWVAPANPIWPRSSSAGSQPPGR